jgi:hypothetical protein
MQNPKFDATNPHFKSRFASLAAVRAAVMPALLKNEIALTQELQTTERGIACYTHLYHSSGERLTFGPCEIPATKDNAHGFGSAATYARRYSLMAACNVVGDEDDDANTAVEPAENGDQVKYMHLVLDNWDTITEAKGYLANDEVDQAVAVFNELPDEVKRGLWKSFTKGGVWTVEEYNKFKGRKAKGKD